MLKRFLITLSFTNLCFYNIIFTLFYKKLFYVKHLPTANSYLALIVSELLIAISLMLIWEIITRLNKPWLTKAVKGLIFLVLLIVLDDAVKDVININGKLFRLCLLAITGLLVIFKKTTKAAISFILVTAPFVFFIFAQSFTYAITHWNKIETPKPIQTLTMPKQTPRVLWVIFDELDYQVAFGERPQGINLPTFDRFKNQAFFAENAFPPSASTTLSLTSFIDGKLVSNASEIGMNQLKITYHDTGETVDWGSNPNVFSKARELKVNTALVGEYLPYSRLIGKDLSYCSWYPFYPEYISATDTLFANIQSQLYFLLAGPAKTTIQRKRSFYNILNDAKNLVANPDYGLIMIHFPIPHGPHFYKNHWWERSAKGYLNALILADETLKQLWDILDDKGLWEDTSVIISSDHFLRGHKKYFNYPTKDYRIPFILKMAGQKETISYQPSFNTFITSGLVLAILKEDVSTVNDVVSWFNDNKTNPIKY